MIMFDAAYSDSGGDGGECLSLVFAAADSDDDDVECLDVSDSDDGDGNLPCILFFVFCCLVHMMQLALPSHAFHVLVIDQKSLCCMFVYPAWFFYTNPESRGACFTCVSRLPACFTQNSRVAELVLHACISCLHVLLKARE